MKVLERTQIPGVLIVGILVSALASAGCKRKDAAPKDDGAGAADESPSTAASASVKTTASASAKAGDMRLEPLPGGTVSVLKGYKPETFQIPVGPLLGIFPGKGIGAIRFGASVETIERLMQSKCGQKTETSCRYAAQAVEFRLEEGVVSEIRIQGDERAFSNDANVTYGVFNGRFPEGAALGMYPQFVIEALGEPKRKEPAKPDEESPTVERHYYDDMVLEYDKLANGNVVLGGVILTRPDGKNAPAPKPARPKQKAAAPAK